MLILTRRAGETVMIGSDVTITVLGVKGNQVRIGINAPKDVAVHREEIFERIQSEKASGEVAEGGCVGDSHRAGRRHPAGSRGSSTESGATRRREAAGWRRRASTGGRN